MKHVRCIVHKYLYTENLFSSVHSLHTFPPPFVGTKIPAFHIHTTQSLKVSATVTTEFLKSADRPANSAKLNSLDYRVWNELE
jgi:hypothetical protein